MSDAFIEQLKQVCREYPARTKWVFIPTPSLRWTLGERLLREGCNWINLRFVTPFELALQQAAPALLDRGINPSPETLGPSLLQNLLLSEGPRPGYFLPLMLQPGMADALWRTLGEFRMAGLHARDLSRLPKGPKLTELKWVFGAYEKYLATNQLADRAAIFHSVTSADVILPDDLVLIYPDHAWSPVEEQWLAQAGGRHLPEATDPAEQPTAPEFFCATRRGDEVDEIARRLLASRIPLDQVEIAATEHDYPTINDRLAAHGFPCTFDNGLPMAHSRPGQALDGLLSWLDHGVTAFHLRELLAGDLLRARPNSFTATRLLEAAQVTWGRETYHPQLQALAEFSKRRDNCDPALLANIEELKQWLRTLFQRFPPPDGQGQIHAVRWLSGLQQTLLEDFAAHDPGENSSRQTLLRALEELKLLPGERWALARFLPLVRQRIENLRANANRPRPGHIHVTSPATLGLSGRTTCFWVGLEEGRLLKAPPEDCVLSDEERAVLHPGLKQASQRTDETLRQIRKRLRTLPGKLTMSYAQRDEAGDQEQLPSWLLWESARRYHPHLDTYDKLVSWLGPPVASRPLQPSQETVHELFPHLGRGSQAETMRNSDEFTVYDGYVASAAGRWDPRTTGQPISVSRLKALATCPFQVFLENGLGLRQPPLALPEADLWLDAATRGTVLHEVYAAYHRGLKARGWTPDPTRDKAQLHSLLNEQLERVRALLPPPSVALEKTERLSLKRDLEHFLQLECQSSGRRPVGFEVGFGMGADPLEQLAQAEPVVLDLGEGVQLPVRGRIDRIDVLADGYGVVDYKTGRRLYTSSKNAVYYQGRLLQHALYALVVERMLWPVTQSSYYFPTSVAQRSWWHFPYPSRVDFARVMHQVLEPLSSGAFAHTHEQEKDCSFCAYRAACEAHDDKANLRKLQNPANTVLEHRRRLLEER